MKQIRLDHVCEKIFTGIPPRLRTTGETNLESREITILGIRAITPQGELKLDALEAMVVTDPAASNLRPLRANDVLLSIRGSLPKCAMVEEDFETPVYASGNLAVLRPNPAMIAPAYLWAVLLRTCRIQSHPLLTRATTGQLSIRQSDLAALPLSLPAIVQQQQIGEAAIALRDAIAAQQAALDQGERTLNAFLRDVMS